MFSKLCCENRIYRNLINGEWAVEPARLMGIRSPIDGSLVGRVQSMSREDVDAVFKYAKQAQAEWRNVPINERADILYKAADLIERYSDDMTRIMVDEIAKDEKGCRAELNRTADYIRFTADSAKTMEGESITADSFPGFKKNKISVVTREPLGVVLAISPFNYPINLAASKIAPALVAGNTVVFKPATQGSISGLYLARIFQEAGLLPGVLNTVTGRGSEIGDHCVTHPLVDFINFTGSTEVGRHISQITCMKPLLLELGGKDAAIILPDADLELAASNIIAGAYSYSGQRCTAVKRILVVDEVADNLISLLKNKMEGLRMGNPREEQVDIVPLIDSKAADFVEGLMKDAEAKGAVTVTGGQRSGSYISPTLYDHVTTDMRLAWEEPFGPILPIIRVKDADEAISIANRSEYGLQTSVFTQNINSAFYVADKLEVGTVQVNNKTERGPDHFPFLGIKASGMGTQGIRYSIEAMSRPKGIVINVG